MDSIFFADLEPAMIGITKSAAGPVGHFSPSDVLRLPINRNPAPQVVDPHPAPPSASPRPRSSPSTA
ncbi:hypothetical protein ABZ490_49875 [Streptomyces sp. NPDC005811]|uniref:hypothetical protein n=1 Tax=Streptomyces sp. NPDC005811 TaxID=3154565 RepID=UPI0033DA43A7